MTIKLYPFRLGLASGNIIWAERNLGDCHGCGGAGRVLPSLREELTEIIRWRFKTADGAPMNGPLVLKRAQEIANEIAPHIEEAVGER